MRWIQDTKSIVTGNHRSGGILCDYFMKFSHIYEKCASGYRTHSGVHPSKTSQSVTILTTPTAVWSLGVGGN